MMKRRSKRQLETALLLAVAAMSNWGYGEAASSVIDQKDQVIADNVDATATNPAGSNTTLAALTVSSAASGGTVKINSPSITGTFTSEWTLTEADQQTAALGLRIQNGYTGTVEIGTGTQITLNGQGNNFSGSALGIQSSTAQVQLGDGVGLTYTYSNQGIGTGNGNLQNGSALYNAGGTVSTGEKLTVRADTGVAGDTNTVGLFNTRGGSLAVGNQADIQVRGMVMQDKSEIVYGIQSGKADEQNQRNTLKLGKDSQVKAEMDRTGSTSKGSLSAIQLWHSDFELGENLQTETLLKGWTNTVSGLGFHDAKGTIGAGLHNQVETKTMENGTASYEISLVGIKLDQKSQVTLGDGSQNQVTVGANGSSLVAGMQILDGSVLNLGSGSRTEVSVQGTPWKGNSGLVIGADVQDEGSLLKGGDGTTISVAHDADNKVEVKGLSAQNKGSIQLGAHTTLQVSSAQASAQGISAVGGTVELGNQAFLTATAGESAVAEGIFTQQEGSKATLGDGAQVKVTAKEGAMAIGVYADKSGENQIGTGAVLTAASEADSSMALAATGGTNRIGDSARIQASSQSGTAYGTYGKSEGTNQIGDSAQIQASSQSSYAYGTYSDVGGENVLGKGAVVSASSETGAATGIFTSTDSHTLAGDGITVTAAGSKGIGVYSEHQGVANFLGAARISGGRYSLVSLDTGSLIDLAADGTKIIDGNMMARYGGAVDVRMNTGDSRFTGASLVADPGSELNLDMSNGAQWNMTGGSSVTNLTLNSGAVVNMTANPDYQQLTAENFSGNDGTFYMKTDLDSQTDGDKV
ncbi:hypothetical protein, partial [Mitsuokella sp. AF21-1AC]|uniref:hypothetical protein n=1 Tax=Mitsuokella sp. AF21-1AC TaxID=2292235 RepID=UPI000FF619FB